MSNAIDSSVAQVLGVTKNARRRWRMARVLRGAAIACAGILVTLVTAALVLDAARYAPQAVIASRIIVALLAVGLLTRFFVLPLLPRPRDEQVALYVEEHEPTLEGALVSAVEVSQLRAGPQPRSMSASIAERVRGMALERSHAIDDGRRVDARNVQQAFAALAGAAAMLLVALAVGPDRLRYGMGALLAPWEDADAVNPYRLDVDPGDATIARGASIVVMARPVGFQPDGAELWARTSDSAAWTRIAMTADSARHFSARLLDVAVTTEYLVETNGLRSRAYRLKVADLPYARRLDLEYRFPAYTGLPVQRVDSAGDIAALAGTMVRVRVTPTVPTPGGRLVVDDGDTLKLSPMPDGSLVATLRVKRPGFYHVELEGARGDLLTASLKYAIDVLPDRPPSVRFTRPGRDTKVLAVDEVYTEARAEDDYGIARLELVYSVNGAEEKVTPLHQASRIIRDISAGHTFMLEDYLLQPGDVVSYYARAIDNDAVSGAKTATSDIYFMQVRPYAQEYRQAQEGGGGGGGGGQGESPGQLSQRERDIIAGTFNSTRDSALADRRTLEEDMATLRLSQQRLREDVEQLARRLVERGVVSTDSNLARIAEILPVAAAAMDTAERALAAGRLRAALQPEQRALQQLQRAEAVFRNVRVSMGNEAEGGGGGGGGSQAEDLADLFELQRERLRNQYETVQRGDESQQRADQQVDATAERLKQLAARQQQENERARRKADSLGAVGASGASGGDAQRQLAQETEQAARQLERLARERESQSLSDAARRMNEAADAMRRSASRGGQRGAADAATAMDRLRDARRLLEAERENRVQRAVEDAANTGRRLAEEQRRVREDVARQGSATGQERADLQRAIEQRKGAMADTARALAGRLDRIALDGRREQPAVAREVEEAADTLRTRRIEDKLRITQHGVRDIPQESQVANERIISADIEQLNRALEEARGAARAGRAADGERRNADAMDRARDLVRGIESLDERMRQQQSQRSGQQTGQPGQQRGLQGGGIASGQISREMRERLNDARELRRELSRRGGVDLSQLDRAIGRMESLLRDGSNADPRAERELRSQVIEGLRAFEFVLGRALSDSISERVLVDRAGEIPPQYRKYVEEYYRSLGRAKPR